jgi:hypothetical protein
MALLLRDMLPPLASPPELFDPAFSDVDRAIMQSLQLNPIQVNESGARSVAVPTLFYLPHLEVSARPRAPRRRWRSVPPLAALRQNPTRPCASLQAALCDNLLAANWSPQQLPLLAILGNSFGHHGERFSMRSANPNIKRPEKMLRLLQAGGRRRRRLPCQAGLEGSVLCAQPGQGAGGPAARALVRSWILGRPVTLLLLLPRAAAGAVLELPVPDHRFHVASAFNNMSLHVFPADRLAAAGPGLWA